MYAYISHLCLFQDTVLAIDASLEEMRSPFMEDTGHLLKLLPSFQTLLLKA